MTIENSIKKALHTACCAYVQERIDSIKLVIREAQLAANDETKSSAGDKYETGRSMMQLEIEKNTIQLSEVLKLQKVMHHINPEKENFVAEIGSVVFTSHGNFYLAVSAGNLTMEGESYFAVSAASPIGQQLMNKKENDSFVFNKKEYKVHQVL